MAAPSLSPIDSATSSREGSATGLGRLLEPTARIATSWVGLVTAYIGSITAAVIAFQKLANPLKGVPVWLRAALVLLLPILALTFQTIPTLIELRKRKKLSEITGQLKSGYFRLSPRSEEASFTRTDGKHQEVLKWLAERKSPVLYLTGLSGSGKSSLLTAWVFPNLIRNSDTLVVSLRGYQEPIAVLEQELQKPNVIWQKPPSEVLDIRTLLDRAARHIRPRRLLIVLDQFEEFVILHDRAKQQNLEQLLSSLCEHPIEGITFLLVLRNDYIGLIENLDLPPLLQENNWKEVPPFTEAAAREFLQSSGLQVADELLTDILREAAEIEGTKGLIRPVTINLCGLVLGRFNTGLPRQFKVGNLIRGFVRESIFLPKIREIAPRLIPLLTTNYVTKKPRTVSELAHETGFQPGEIRGCLWVLGQSDRAIVRPLDADQQTWEISHDFLVPLLDSITARWTISLWRRFRPWLPWLAATMLTVGAVVGSAWKKHPVVELDELGWQIQRGDFALSLSFEGDPPPESFRALKRIGERLHVSLRNTSTVAQLRDVTSLVSLYIADNKIHNLSFLEDLKHLENLDISGNPVSDLTPLSNLKALTALTASRTLINDLSPLKNLPSLTYLDITSTQVTDFSPLSGLPNLEKLKLESGLLTDLSPLADLHNLQSLLLWGCENLSDISAIKRLNKLTVLDLSSTHVTDLAPLSGLVNLSDLDLISSYVKDLTPLKTLKNLKRLSLARTRVTDISPLQDLTNLSDLDLAGTKIKDLSPLRNLPNLVSLRVDDATTVRDRALLNDIYSRMAQRQKAK